MGTLHFIADASKTGTGSTLADTLNGLLGGLKSLYAKATCTDAKKQLQLIESLPLGGRRQLALVRCGNEQFLVGMGQDGVQSIVCTAARAERASETGCEAAERKAIQGEMQ